MAIQIPEDAPGAASFVTLPLELRNTIYKYLLQDSAIALSASLRDYPRYAGYALHGRGVPLSLWFVCRQVVSEINVLVPLLRTTMHLECAPHMIHVVHKSFSGMLNLVPSQWLSTVRKIEVDKAWIGGLNLALFKAALPSLSTVEVQLPIANETLEMGESWLVLARCETLDQKTRVDCRLSPSHDGSLDWVAAYLQWSNAANTSPAISLQARQPLHIWKEQEVFVVLELHYDMVTRELTRITKGAVHQRKTFSELWETGNQAGQQSMRMRTGSPNLAAPLLVPSCAIL